MHLDIITLMAAGSFVAALSGILLTGAWTQMRGEPALLWWAAAKYIFALGIGLLSYGAATSSVVMLAIGGLVTAVAPALLWAGTRDICRGPTGHTTESRSATACRAGGRSDTGSFRL